MTLQDTTVFEGERSAKTLSLSSARISTEPTETFQYTHFPSCHAPGIKKGNVKDEAL